MVSNHSTPCMSRIPTRQTFIRACRINRLMQVTTYTKMAFFRITQTRIVWCKIHFYIIKGDFHNIPNKPRTTSLTRRAGSPLFLIKTQHLKYPLNMTSIIKIKTTINLSHPPFIILVRRHKIIKTSKRHNKSSFSRAVLLIKT